MIRNKTTTVVLSVTAMVVWGIVIFRVVRSVRTTPRLEQAAEIRMPRTGIGRDTLKLNYPDPFLEIGQENSRSAVPLTGRLLPQKAVCPAPAFRYKGKIRKRRQDFLMLEKEGKPLLVTGQGEVDGYKVVVVTTDSLVVQKMGQRFVLRME